MMRPHHLLLVLLLPGFSACSGDGGWHDISGDVTIDQGVYGQLVILGDVPEEPPQYFSGGDLSAGSITTPLRGYGFYQLELDPGSYQLCYSNASSLIDGSECTFVDVPSGVVRCDMLRSNLPRAAWACSAE